MDPVDETERERLVTVADYQFGAGAGAALFEGPLAVERSRSGRPRQVHVADGPRLVSLGTDGRFTLGVAGGRRLLAAGGPAVEVGEESVPYVRDGRNAFAKFVRAVPPEVRPGDEVAVTHDGALLAVGRAELPADAMRDFRTGVAVKVRAGAGASDGE